MIQNPRHRGEYDSRQTEAANRVLVDVGQVLASFQDCLVVVGGWVPDLLLVGAEEPHVGSIDVDLALDALKLKGGRYAELIGLLLQTRRYRAGTKTFQLLTDVDLGDGGRPIEVAVEFLSPKGVRFKKNRPQLLADFRVLEAEGCATAFREPVSIELAGQTIRGATNKVHLRVAALQDFLIMKAYALAGRDKPKDAYDLCYCLDNFPGGLEKLAEAWRRRSAESDVKRAIEILREKFNRVDAFGPAHVVEFFDAPDIDTRAMQARRAFELVRRLLALL